MIELNTPIRTIDTDKLKVGDMVLISGMIYCGRDAVLPHIVKMAEKGELAENGIDLDGTVIFHTAVSPAGVGPTSSNKLEIERSMIPLSKAGVKVHLGKGKIGSDTIAGISEYSSVYAVIPPVTALLESKMIERKLIAFPELGMEAFYCIKAEGFPAIIAAAKGKSIY